MSRHISGFYAKASEQAKKKRKESLRTIGMGGIGKRPTEFSPPTLEVKTK
jgi:hypothetical protein